MDSAKKLKVNTRHPKWIIQHNYHDRLKDSPIDDADFDVMRYFSASSVEDVDVLRFPLKLHKLLLMTEKEGYDDIISWQVHGRAFKIHKEKNFFSEIIPLHFSHSCVSSFCRQLNLYGFSKITQGCDKGAYYHECFLRGKYFLARKIDRVKVKGTFVKGAANPADEPNFHTMPFVQGIFFYPKKSTTALPERNLLREDGACAKNKILCSNTTEAYFFDDGEIDPLDIGVTEDLYLCDDVSFSFFPRGFETSSSLDDRGIDPFDIAVTEASSVCNQSSFSNVPPGLEVSTDLDTAKDGSHIEKICIDISTGDFEPMSQLDYSVPEDLLFGFDTYFSSLMQGPIASTGLGDAKCDTHNCCELFTHNSFEDEISNSKQVFTFTEYVDTCTLLQMIIKELD